MVQQWLQPEVAGCETYPWRKTAVVGKDSGEVVDLGRPEHGQNYLGQSKWSTGPAQLSLSIFGTKEGGFGAISSVPVFGQPPQDHHAEAKVPGDVLPPPVVDDQTMEEPLDSLETVAEWGPRIISKSGPGFLSLNSGEQSELRSLGHRPHQNGTVSGNQPLSRGQKTWHVTRVLKPKGDLKELNRAKYMKP